MGKEEEREEDCAAHPSIIANYGPRLNRRAPTSRGEYSFPMRMGIVALALLAIVVTLSTMEPTSSSRTPQRSEGPGPDHGESRASGSVAPLVPGSPTAATVATVTTVTTVASTTAVPAPSSRPLQRSDGPGSNLPNTLELVALPAAPGAPAPAPKAISRTEALASVIGSREFQDTVSPLARLYFATFGRFPDYEGLNYYTGQREEARPLAEIATEFAGSREFEQRYGELSNAEFVARIAANVLGHESQADVRAYWTDALDAGRMTRGQVIVDLAESGMFRERTSNEVFVSTAYTEVLRRTPDPAGYAFWVAQLEAGVPRDNVIDGLLRKP